MAARLAPILADDKDAAALLSMKPTEFRALVEAGHLPKPREIAPGFPRWDVEELRRIARGDADFGDEMQW
jgi:predicted DNA-binding transcriptional regulator AlpA